MRHISRWFSTDFVARENPYWDGVVPWYRRVYERNGGPGYGPESRWRLLVGDLVAEGECDGGDPAGIHFGIDLRLWEDVGHFDYDDTDRWHDHSVMFIVWRWGVYFAWRGGLKAARS